MTDPTTRGLPVPPPGAPPFYPPYWPAPEGDEISLLDLLDVLRRRRKRIAAVTFAGTALAVAYALLATPIYRAQAVIAPPSQTRGGGGAAAALAAFGGLGAELAGSLGFGLASADANRIEALLKSRRVLERVVAKNDLLPILFEKTWDAAKKTWTVEDPKDIPNFWDAEKKLENIYRVKNDLKTGVLQVSFDWKDTAVAKQVLQSFLAELALVVQEDELKKIEANRKFAEEQLGLTRDPVVIAKLQGLLSEQVEKAMMARSLEQLAYILIDPPAVSDQKVKPKRALIGALGLMASGLLGVFSAFVAEWLANARRGRSGGEG